MSEVLKKYFLIGITFLFAIICVALKEYDYKAAQLLYFSVLVVSELVLLLSMYKNPNGF